MMDIDRFRELPLMGILRGVQSDVIEPIVETAVSSGLQTIEVTMNTPGAPDLIKRAVKCARGRIMVGAGTVVTSEHMKLALDAGAGFIVSPMLIYDVVEYCRDNEIPVFPGALTPQEIYNAWIAGATMVKVFPSNLLGPEYIKEVKGPFNSIEMLACGGVTPENIRSYFDCGASAVAFGGSVFREEWVKARDFDSIGRSIKALISAYNESR
ncbi:MAG: bifunctional 4-hydroxy-2-oxoglutarate aldolase/2-dehydro-3-deoxy-phosphogluconate aldolase [Dehalococcoidia bacterium]|jgi:2-dehydro-3-deoxyphosphogluconate aldolase/(4S)-4-hydroxy-2-oxoglutarate aldolase